MKPQSRQITLFGKVVPYRVIRSSRRRTLAIEIDPQAGTTVRANHTASIDMIEKFLLEKSRWVLGHLADIEDKASQPLKRRYENGEVFHYLGAEYTLGLVPASREFPPGEVRLTGGALEVAVFDDLVEHDRVKVVREPLASWYRYQAGLYLPGRLKAFTAILGLSEPRLIIRHQQKRWGSCSPSGELRINLRIMMAPALVIDYVVAHEICHLLVMNHSKRFWSTVEQVMPDYRARRQMLRETEHLYVL